MYAQIECVDGRVSPRNPVGVVGDEVCPAAFRAQAVQIVCVPILNCPTFGFGNGCFGFIQDCVEVPFAPAFGGGDGGDGGGDGGGDCDPPPSCVAPFVANLLSCSCECDVSQLSCVSPSYPDLNSCACVSSSSTSCGPDSVTHEIVYAGRTDTFCCPAGYDSYTTAISGGPIECGSPGLYFRDEESGLYFCYTCAVGGSGGEVIIIGSSSSSFVSSSSSVDSSSSSGEAGDFYYCVSSDLSGGGVSSDDFCVSIYDLDFFVHRVVGGPYLFGVCEGVCGVVSSSSSFGFSSSSSLDDFVFSSSSSVVLSSSSSSSGVSGGGVIFPYLCVRSRSLEFGSLDLPELSGLVPVYTQSSVQSGVQLANSGEMMNGLGYDSSYPVYQTMTGVGSFNWVMADYGQVGVFRGVRVGPPPCHKLSPLDGWAIGAMNGATSSGDVGCDGSYYLGSVVESSVDAISWEVVGVTTSVPFFNSDRTLVGVEFVGDDRLKQARYIRVVGNGVRLGLSELHAVGSGSSSSSSGSEGVVSGVFCLPLGEYDSSVYESVSGPYFDLGSCELNCVDVSSSSSSGLLESSSSFSEGSSSSLDDRDDSEGSSDSSFDDSSSSSSSSSLESSSSSLGFSSSSSSVLSSSSSSLVSDSSSSVEFGDGDGGDGGDGGPGASSGSEGDGGGSLVSSSSSISSFLVSSSSSDSYAHLDASLVTVLDSNPELPGLYYGEDSVNGWVIVSGEGLEFRYEALGFDGLPLSSNVYLGGEALATIIYPPSYLGNEFCVVRSGVFYCGVVVEGDVNL